MDRSIIFGRAIDENRFSAYNIVYVVVSVNTMQFYIAQSSLQNFPDMQILGVFSRRNDAQKCADTIRVSGTNVFIYEAEYDKPQHIASSASSYIN